MKKLIIALISIILVLIISSCGTENTNGTFANLNGEFVLLSETEVSSTLPAPYKPGEGFYEKIIGKGALYGNKESDIFITTDGMSVTLTVDEKQVAFYAEGLEGAQIVDINNNDGVNELAVYSAGPSMDPTVHFFRYDGKTLVAMPFISETTTSFVPYEMYGYHGGTEESILPTYGAIWTDRNGKLLNSMQYTGFSNPRFALSYYELNGNQFEEKELKKESLALPKKVKARDEFQIFFTPMKKSPETFENSAFFNDFENPKVIQKDQEFKISDYGKCYNYYSFFIEIDGEKGVATFWTGD